MDQDKDGWNKLQREIKDLSLEDKKLLLRDYYRNSSIIEKSNELLLNFKNNCIDIIKTLPSEVQSSIKLLLNMILKREK